MMRVITTHDQLAGLPTGSVIMPAAKNAAWRKGVDGWGCTNHDVKVNAEHFALPVTVIYHPGEDE